MRVDEDGNVNVRYCEGESGWVKPLGEGRYKILNTPMTSGLRWGDIVSVIDSDDGRPIVHEVLERKMENGGTLSYDTLEDWAMIIAKFESRYKRWEDFALEGLFAPCAGTPGLAAISYTENVDVSIIIRDLPGVRFKTEEEALDEDESESES